MSFGPIFEFEKALATYTGAPYAVMTDCCSHAIEMCMIYDGVKQCSFTPYTYVSVPMIMHKLGIDYTFLDHAWQRWVGEYQFINTRIWDSARRLEPGMYRPGQLQCLSFGHSKPLELGRGGAILLDDHDAYVALSQMRSDGRDLHISPWETQTQFRVGYHYRPTIEEAVKALTLLEQVTPIRQQTLYPDCRKITIHDQ